MNKYHIRFRLWMFECSFTKGVLCFSGYGERKRMYIKLNDDCFSRAAVCGFHSIKLVDRKIVELVECIKRSKDILYWFDKDKCISKNQFTFYFTVQIFSFELCVVLFFSPYVFKRFLSLLSTQTNYMGWWMNGYQYLSPFFLHFMYFSFQFFCLIITVQ